MCRYLCLCTILVAMPVLAFAQQDSIADQHLQEVVVTAKLPLVEYTPGKTSFRMDESITQSTGSLYDVLTSLPGVMINSGGAILLNGQSGAKVLIDGKPTYLSGEELVNLLKSTPATNTDKIDLITQPSANYDAAGSTGMIDIRTRKIKLRGMNLALNGNYNQGKVPNGYGSVSLNVREDKFNFYLNYSYYQGKQQVDMKTDCVLARQEDYRRQTSYRHRDNRSHSFRVGCDFYPAEHTLFSVTASGNITNQDEDAGMYTEIQSSGTEGWTYTNTSHAWNNLSAGVLLNRRLEKEGGEINLSFDYFRYSHPEDQLIYSFKPDTLKGKMQGNIDLYTAQADVSYPFNDYWKIQAGAKTSFVEIDNSAGYLHPFAGGWQPDGALGSRFIYNENINAAYLKTDLEYNKLKLSAGLRMEHTHVKGKSGGNAVQNDSLFTIDYVHLFPTIALQYVLPEGDAFLFFYGKRITRPNYRDLNPFIYIFDDYTYDVGNTKLRPSFSDNVELGYVYRNGLQAVLFFSHTGDAITKSYQEREHQRIYVMPENLSSYIQTGIRLNISNLSLTEWWQTNVTLIGMYNDYHWMEKGTEIINRRLTPLFNCMNQFTFRSNWSAELSASYNGKMAYGQATVHPFSEVNLGIRKKIFAGKGTVGLFAKDIFNTNYQKIDLLLSGERSWLDERENKRMVGISFSYRFQKGNEVKERKRKNSMEETKRVNL